MSQWGRGNFENDSACDTLGIVCSDAIEKIREGLKLESDEAIYAEGDSTVAYVDILGTLILYYKFCPILELEEVKHWQTQFLQVYDNIVETIMNPEFKKEALDRREVVEDTFRRLYYIFESMLKL